MDLGDMSRNEDEESLTSLRLRLLLVIGFINSIFVGIKD